MVRAFTPSICNVCGSEFATPQELWRHRRARHAGRIRKRISAAASKAMSSDERTERRQGQNRESQRRHRELQKQQKLTERVSGGSSKVGVSPTASQPAGVRFSASFSPSTASPSSSLPSAHHHPQKAHPLGPGLPPLPPARLSLRRPPPYHGPPFDMDDFDSQLDDDSDNDADGFDDSDTSTRPRRTAGTTGLMAYHTAASSTSHPTPSSVARNRVTETLLGLLGARSGNRVEGDLALCRSQDEMLKVLHHHTHLAARPVCGVRRRPRHTDAMDTDEDDRSNGIELTEDDKRTALFEVIGNCHHCNLIFPHDGRDGFESGYSNSGGDLDEEEEEELEGDSSGSEAEEDDDEDEGEEKEEEDDDDEEEKERAEAAAAPMELDDDTDLHNIKLLIPDVKDCFITTDYSSNAVAKALGTLDFSDILALCKAGGYSLDASPSKGSELLDKPNTGNLFPQYTKGSGLLDDPARRQLPEHAGGKGPPPDIVFMVRDGHSTRRSSAASSSSSSSSGGDRTENDGAKANKDANNSRRERERKKRGGQQQKQQAAATQHRQQAAAKRRKERVQLKKEKKNKQQAKQQQPKPHRKKQPKQYGTVVVGSNEYWNMRATWKIYTKGNPKVEGSEAVKAFILAGCKKSPYLGDGAVEAFEDFYSEFHTLGKDDSTAHLIMVYEKQEPEEGEAENRAKVVGFCAVRVVPEQPAACSLPPTAVGSASSSYGVIDSMFCDVAGGGLGTRALASALGWLKGRVTAIKAELNGENFSSFGCITSAAGIEGIKYIIACHQDGNYSLFGYFEGRQARWERFFKNVKWGPRRDFLSVRDVPGFDEEELEGGGRSAVWLYATRPSEEVIESHELFSFGFPLAEGKPYTIDRWGIGVVGQVVKALPNPKGSARPQLVNEKKYKMAKWPNLFELKGK